MQSSEATIQGSSFVFPRIAVITGGNGYVGSELIRQLMASGAEVHAVANANTNRLGALLPRDCIHSLGNDFAAISALVTKLQPEAIYHLAAAVHAEPTGLDQMMATLQSGLLLGSSLLQGAVECRQPPVFLHAGTFWQFDAGGYNPNSFYAAAKQAFHDLLTYYCRVRSLRGATLVLYDIFGPNDTRRKLWNTLRQSQPHSVLSLTEGRQYIELVHVADVARAFLQASSLLMQGVPLELVYSVRSGVRITLRELLEEVRLRASLELEFDWGAIPYGPGQSFEPWIGAALPGWSPAVGPVDGITALVLEGSVSKPAPRPASEEV